MGYRLLNLLPIVKRCEKVLQGLCISQINCSEVNEHVDFVKLVRLKP